MIVLHEYLLFFRFLWRPTFISKPSNKIKLSKILSIALFLIPVCYILNLVITLTFVKSYFCLGKDLVEQDFLTKGPLISIIGGCLLTPIFEEFLFRFYLNKLYGNLIYVFINLFILLYSFARLTFNQITVFILISIFTLSAVCILLEKNYAFRRLVILFLKKQFFLFFYLSALTFGIVHVNNYQICNNHSVWTIFLILPQLFAGFVLGYTRLKYGIWTGIILHSLLNLIAIGLLFLTK